MLGYRSRKDALRDDLNAATSRLAPHHVLRRAWVWLMWAAIIVVWAMLVTLIVVIVYNVAAG